MRIPFDNVVLRAVTLELQSYVGGRVQGIRQPDDTQLAVGLYAGGAEAMLLLCCHPEFARAHFITRRPKNQPQPPTFCATVRARVEGASLRSVTQVAGDRILELEFETDAGIHTLVAELMGKHSNLILVDGGGRIVTAAKWIAASRSVRPVISGQPYRRPPTFDPAQITLSPFAKKLEAAGGTLSPPFHPILSPGNGAYPVSVAPLGLPEIAKSSISVALESHFETAIRDHEIHSLRTNLVTQLQRVLLARETALNDLRLALEHGERAGCMQLCGELILAYGATLEQGAEALTAWDYSGNEVTIKLSPDLGFKENANAYFDRAKKAKGRMGLVRDQIHRLQTDSDAVAGLLDRVQSEGRLDGLLDLREQANGRRWLNQQSPTGAKPKDERPFEGHRVRELLGPGGYAVLYGENAESNDYLTLRVAKPNDWWLHIRGGQSSHVVVVTRNQPDRVGREVLMFAAKVAVQHSPSKHSGYVAVDYTLKKYVRKPRGAPKGTALYTHEKTLHVELDGD